MLSSTVDYTTAKLTSVVACKQQFLYQDLQVVDFVAKCVGMERD